MSTPEQPNQQPNPYGQPAPQQQPPPAPQQQQPPAPGYPAAPQGEGVPTAPQYGAPGMPVAPQYGVPGMPVAPQYAGGPAPFAGPPVERPASLTLAVRLMFVGAALSVVSLIAAWATKSQLHDQILDATKKSTTTLTPSEIDTLVNASLIVATVFGIVGVGLWIWMALANKAGRSWARIVATVFGGFYALSTLSTVATGRASGASAGVGVITLVLAVVIIVLLWRPASTAFYKYRSAKVTMA